MHDQASLAAVASVVGLSCQRAESEDALLFPTWQGRRFGSEVFGEQVGERVACSVFISFGFVSCYAIKEKVRSVAAPRRSAHHAQQTSGSWWGKQRKRSGNSECSTHTHTHMYAHTRTCTHMHAHSLDGFTPSNYFTLHPVPPGTCVPIFQVRALRPRV